MPLVGKKVPNWNATAYLNGEEVELSSSDYSSGWYVLYFYPLDFTFICPTEIKGFQSLYKDFEDIGVAVVGASTDSYHSHNAWLADEKTFPEKISHPIIADTSHGICKDFGVLNEEAGVAYRATVIVDDNDTIRSLAINDLSAGRSPSETLRTVLALQSGGLCGVDWQPGDSFAA